MKKISEKTLIQVAEEQVQNAEKYIKIKRRIKSSIAFILVKISIFFMDSSNNLRHYAKMLDEDADRKWYIY